MPTLFTAVVMVVVVAVKAASIAVRDLFSGADVSDGGGGSARRLPAARLAAGESSGGLGSGATRTRRNVGSVRYPGDTSSVVVAAANDGDDNDDDDDDDDGPDSAKSTDGGGSSVR